VGLSMHDIPVTGGYEPVVQGSHSVQSGEAAGGRGVRSRPLQ